jgi:hypothetical protein
LFINAFSVFFRLFPGISGYFHISLGYCAWIEDADYRVLEVAAREMNLETREYIERVLVNKASQLRRRA